MKTKEQKSKIVENLAGKLCKYPAMIFAEYHGMTVADFDELRSKIHNPAVSAPPEFEVIKNNLLAKALEKTKNPAAEWVSRLKGPLAVLWSDDVVAASKAIMEFASNNQKIKLRFAVAGGKTITDKEVAAYSKLPSREVLIAQLIGAIRGPVAGLVGILVAPSRNLVTILHQKSVSGGDRNK